jgi:hypothetical protein
MAKFQPGPPGEGAPIEDPASVDLGVGRPGGAGRRLRRVGDVAEQAARAGHAAAVGLGPARAVAVRAADLSAVQRSPGQSDLRAGRRRHARGLQHRWSLDQRRPGQRRLPGHPGLAAVRPRRDRLGDLRPARRPRDPDRLRARHAALRRRPGALAGRARAEVDRDLRSGDLQGDAGALASGPAVREGQRRGDLSRRAAGRPAVHRQARGELRRQDHPAATRRDGRLSPDDRPRPRRRA